MNKFFGAVLLISGTTIGAGMLALPVMTGFGGFFPSLILLVSLWLFMLFTSFLYLEVNISFKGETNLVTMAEKTLGRWGKVVSWITYLLLLYSLTAAYIAASANFFSKTIHAMTGTLLPHWAAPLPLLGLFGIFIYLGSRSADYLNRILMFGLVAAYFILVFFMPEQVDFKLLTHFDMKASFLAVPVMLTSFGFHIIIPTLTTYLKHDKKKLQWAIVIGSIIPLIFYILWEFLTLGVVPLVGQYSLTTAYIKGESGTGPLIHIIREVLKKPWIGTVASIFSFCTIITSLLGVSLSLADFLRDGFKIKKTHSGRLIACLLTFLPPLFFVYYFQRGFIIALQYAGVFVAIILCLIPALMTWKLPKPCIYRSGWGRTLLVAVIIISIMIIGMDIAEEAGLLKKLISGYIK